MYTNGGINIPLTLADQWSRRNAHRCGGTQPIWCRWRINSNDVAAFRWFSVSFALRPLNTYCRCCCRLPFLQLSDCHRFVNAIAHAFHTFNSLEDFIRYIMCRLNIIISRQFHRTTRICPCHGLAFHLTLCDPHLININYVRLSMQLGAPLLWHSSHAAKIAKPEKLYYLFSLKIAAA